MPPRRADRFADSFGLRRNRTAARRERIVAHDRLRIAGIEPDKTFALPMADRPITRHSRKAALRIDEHNGRIRIATKVLKNPEQKARFSPTGRTDEVQMRLKPVLS